MSKEKSLNRRDFIKAGLFSAAGLAGAAATTYRPVPENTLEPEERGNHSDHAGGGTVGSVDNEANGFDPHAFMTHCFLRTLYARFRKAMQ